jgi:mannosyltransferase
MFTLIDHLMTPWVYLTQSLWRDEAFSYVFAKHSFINIIRLAPEDFNPPLYYLFLHFWMKFFGNTEVAMRSMSFIFHLLTCYVIYKFVSKVINHKIGVMALILTFFNPMLLYFSFEARMYSMLAFFSSASMYCFYFKKWGWWFLASLMGMYTHLFFMFVLLVQFIFKKGYWRRFFLLGIFYLPWIPVIFTQVLKGSKDFWVNKIDLQLVLSSIGNIFTSYEGTPGGQWEKTALVSFSIVLFVLFVFRKRRDDFAKLFFLWIFVPLTIIILISLWKPLFVNRYLIFLVIPIIFVLARIIEEAKQLFFPVFLIFLGFELFVFFSLGPYYRKVDIRESVRRTEMQMQKDDLLVSKTPLTFFEVNYYSGFKSYLYAVDKNLIPYYVGRALIDENKILPNFEKAKGRVFLVNDDGSVVVW